jgi:hypothetical protein
MSKADIKLKLACLGIQHHAHSAQDVGDVVRDEGRPQGNIIWGGGGVSMLATSLSGPCGHRRKVTDKKRRFPDQKNRKISGTAVKQVAVPILGHTEQC